jgi:hypothetical protein
MLTLALVPMLALHISLPPQDAARRPGIQPYHVELETDDLRITRVVLAPGERVTADSPAGSVIVYLTANLDGRMPPAEAAWQAAGPIEMENRGRARFEALVIQFKRTVAASAPTAANPPSYPVGGMTRPMWLWAGYGYGNWMDYAYRERVKSETLVDTAGVNVTKVRQPASMYPERLSIDSNDRVVVYLRGGYAWPFDRAQGRSGTISGYGAERVHRGDVRVLTANLPYALSNAGSDPSEFIVIARR